MNFFEKLKLLKKNNATEMNYKMLFQNIIKGIYLSVFLIIILMILLSPSPRGFSIHWILEAKLITM